MDERRAPRFGRRPLLRAGALAAARLALGGAARGADADADPVETLLRHHVRSSHAPGRSAPAPGRLDWSTQPDPFRRFTGAPLLPLALVEPALAPSWDALARLAVPPRPVDHGSISQLLFDSLALSAWKEHGADRWSLRVNPSSGNLHPTEAYVAGGPFPGLTGAPAVLHYAPYPHALELRLAIPPPAWGAIASGLPPGALLVALTSITWREAWKYGLRAYRYCLLDAGHALAAVALAAAGLGWRAAVVASWPDRDVALLCAADRQRGPEAERAEALLAVWPGPAAWDGEARRAFRLPAAARRALADAPALGAPNRLGAGHVAWPELDAAAAAAERLAPAAVEDAPARPPGALPGREGAPPGRALLRGRRTALELDPGVAMPVGVLARLLAATTPAGTPALFAPFPWRPRVHLVVLAHRVDGLAPGAHLFARDEAALPSLRAALGGGEPVGAAGVRLALLRAGELRAAARLASCDQAIASDGALCAVMLAGVEPALRAEGAWAYRRLHWEAGAVGHALYLEAGAAGLGASGIGCFLDGESRRLAGAGGPEPRPLYHLALGAALADPRLRTEAPYGHLGDRGAGVR